MITTMLLIVSAVCQLGVKERVEKIHEIQIKAIQVYEGEIAKLRDHLKQKPNLNPLRHRKRIKFLQTKILAIKRGGVPPNDLDVSTLQIGDIGRLDVSSLKIEEIVDDNVMLTTPFNRRYGRRSEEEQTVFGSAAKASLSASRSSPSRLIRESCQLLLVGWDTKPLREGDSLTREDYNCIIEVTKKQEGCLVIEKVDLDSIRKYLRLASNRRTLW